MTSKNILRFLSAFIGVHLWFFASGLAQQPTLRVAPSEVLVDWARINQEAVQKLGEYIRADTTNPPGNEMRGVKLLRKIFDAEGISYEYAESAPGRGNLVARLKGSGREPALVLLHHIDVVPVNREYWTTDPFSGAVKDGYIWGRGAQDMKSLGVAELMAFLLLHRAKVALNRDVIYLATADEEAGGSFGAGWVVRNRPEWIAGAGYLLNEGAQSPASEDGPSARLGAGKPRYIGASPTEKTPCWLKLTATGTPGHGSLPRPDSAVNKLIAALERLRTWETPLEVTPAIEAALKTLAPYEPEPWRTRFGDIRAFVRTPVARAELGKRPPVLALLTNTVSITGLEGTNKINIIPPVATALVDCRLLPGWTAERWVAEIKRVLKDNSIRVDVLLNFPSTASPTDTPLYRTIEEVVTKVYPGTGVGQTVTAGFTDSHFFREKGIVSYGFGAFVLAAADSGTAHGNDERMAVRAFTDGVRLMWEVVYRFVRAE
jgi:acetylornithine deacetylase/succinyl-diaminopimelate desuccinylase-like protein